MARVRVKTLGYLQNIAGGMEHEIEVESRSTVEDVLKRLVDTYRELSSELYTREGSLNPRIRILVNGRDISHMKGLETSVSDGDIIAIIPPIGGGVPPYPYI